MIKIASFLAILGVAVGAPGAITYAASPYVHAAPVQVLHATPTIVKTVAPEPFDPNPQYNYGYSVQDSLTGDSKAHTETRNGDVVTGQYSLVEPDGSIRTVTYTADSINGFNAVVDRQAPAVALKSVVHQAAPVQVLRAAPVYQAAPVPIYHAAPAHQIAYKHFL